MKYLTLAFLANLLLISGCSTPYQQKVKASGFGFYDKKISDNNYIIGFAGNGFTSISKIKDFILFRSAEVATNNSFQCFAINKTIRYTGYPHLQIDTRKALVWTLESEVELFNNCSAKTDKIIYNTNYQI